MKKGDRFIFCCRLAGPCPPPRVPSSHRQVSPCTASHLTRFAHPSGQPSAVTPLRYVSLAWPRESNQREGHPGIRIWPAARLLSLWRCSGGRFTRAILGPLCGGRLALSPHPCGSSPYATPPLGLLTGIGVRVARESFGLFISSVRTGRRHQPPLQEGERNRRGRG